MHLIFIKYPDLKNLLTKLKLSSPDNRFKNLTFGCLPCKEPHCKTCKMIDTSNTSRPYHPPPPTLHTHAYNTKVEHDIL